MLGFAGSLHCVGMCGPLQSFLTKTKWPFRAMYHYGRYIAYTLVGLLFYFAGYTSELLALQKYFTILTGLFIIGSVFIPFLQRKISFSGLSNRLFTAAKNQNSYLKFFIMGFANGLLPCGLVYVAATQSILDLNIAQTLLMMLLFLLGTLPALLSVNYIYTFLENGQYYFKRLKPVLMLSIGILLIFRGIYNSHTPSTTSAPQMCVSTK